MKSYTDIEQSKKLVNILSLKSADGYWFKGFPSQPYMVYTKGTPNPGEHILCWSLAALFKIVESKCSYFELIHLKTYRLSAEIDDIYGEELIDILYEMILKLHERELL